MRNLTVGEKEQGWRSGNGDRIIVVTGGTEEIDRDHTATNSGSRVNEAQNTPKLKTHALRIVFDPRIGSD